jgi:ABC-type transporter Mla subunit MlaD
MATQVVVKDIAALEKFGSDLRRSREQLQEVASSLRRALATVDSSWQDPQKERCRQQIDDLVRNLTRFGDSAEKQVGYVTRLANHLRSTPH